MKFLSFLLLALPVFFAVTNFGCNVAYAQEDAIDEDIVDDDEEANVLTDTDPIQDSLSTASVDADTTILFTKPTTSHLSSMELPGGQLVEFLVGFTNKGKTDFILENLETSLRYPMDFKFYIQNFTNLVVNKVVKPNHETTLQYSFIPSETFAGRPFGLNINLNYRNANGDLFNEAVYNETVQIVELDEGLDGETVFLYLFLAACVILTLVGGQQLLSSFGKKSRSSSSSKKQVVEIGTSNPNNVDFDWLPNNIVNRLNKSPKEPKQSPRQRNKK